jgi:hypothetical protein
MLKRVSQNCSLSGWLLNLQYFTLSFSQQQQQQQFKRPGKGFACGQQCPYIGACCDGHAAGGIDHDSITRTWQSKGNEAAGASSSLLRPIHDEQLVRCGCSSHAHVDKQQQQQQLTSNGNRPHS